MVITIRNIPYIKPTLVHYKLEIVLVFKLLGVHFGHLYTHLYDTCSKVINQKLCRVLINQLWYCFTRPWSYLVTTCYLDYVFAPASLCHLHRHDHFSLKLWECAGVYATTPRSALQVECSGMPLHLRRQQGYMKYFLQIKTKSRNHAVTELVRTVWNVSRMTGLTAKFHMVFTTVTQLTLLLRLSHPRDVYSSLDWVWNSV